MSSLQCHLERQVIASFERSHHTNTGIDDDGTADMHDGGVYVFDVNSTCDGTAIVSSLSDHHIAVYDSNSLGLIRKFQVHTDSITGFDVSKSTPHLIYTGSEDHHICGWDLRMSDRSVPVLKARLSEEVGAVALGVGDSLLAVGCGTTILFYDVRSTMTTSVPSSSSKPKKLGQYADIHTDTVTQLRFSSSQSHIMASGAEDGLITLFDTATKAGDDAVVSIFNTECPIRRLGFFGHQDEALYCLSTVETASFWHCSSAQRVGSFPQIREQLQVDYLVDCFYDTSSNTLCMLAGAYDGGGKLVLVEPSSLQICGTLDAGHTATIRAVRFLTNISNTSAALSAFTSASAVVPMARLVTVGEDARLCMWTLSPEGASTSSSSSGSSSFKTYHTTTSSGKANRRHKPY